MTRHDYQVTLRQMLDHAQEAVALIQKEQRSSLDQDRKLNLALMRLLEIIGEAASRIPKEKQAEFSDVPWAEIISLRNRLIHGYDQVDLDVLWEIVVQDLPGLITKLRKILG